MSLRPYAIALTAAAGLLVAVPLAYSAEANPYALGTGSRGGLKVPASASQSNVNIGEYFSAKVGRGMSFDDPAPPPSYDLYSRNPSITGIGSLPVGWGFSVTGKVGVADKWSLSAPADPMERGGELSYGIGLKYQPVPSVGLRLGVDRFQSLKGTANGNPDDSTNIFSLGVGIRF